MLVCLTQWRPYSQWRLSIIAGIFCGTCSDFLLSLITTTSRLRPYNKYAAIRSLPAKAGKCVQPGLRSLLKFTGPKYIPFCVTETMPTVAMEMLCICIRFLWYRGARFVLLCSPRFCQLAVFVHLLPRWQQRWLGRTAACVVIVVCPSHAAFHIWLGRWTGLIHFDALPCRHCAGICNGDGHRLMPRVAPNPLRSVLYWFL